VEIDIGVYVGTSIQKLDALTMKSESEIREKLASLTDDKRPARKFGWDDELKIVDAKVKMLEWVLEEDS